MALRRRFSSVFAHHILLTLTGGRPRPSTQRWQSEMIHVKVGDPLEKTIDLLTSCGNINFVNESLQQLEADYAHFHEICQQGIFRVE